MPPPDLKSSPTGCVVATVAFADLSRMHAEFPKLALKLLQRLAAVCAAKETHAAREAVTPAALDAKKTTAAVRGPALNGSQSARFPALRDIWSVPV